MKLCKDEILNFKKNPKLARSRKIRYIYYFTAKCHKNSHWIWKPKFVNELFCFSQKQKIVEENSKIARKANPAKPSNIKKKIITLQDSV
jgi:hypothetical protein